MHNWLKLLNCNTKEYLSQHQSYSQDKKKKLKTLLQEGRPSFKGKTKKWKPDKDFGADNYGGMTLCHDTKKLDKKVGNWILKSGNIYQVGKDEDDYEYALIPSEIVYVNSKDKSKMIYLDSETIEHNINDAEIRKFWNSSNFSSYCPMDV